MDKKIIFFDIDGTLLYEGEYSIPNSAIDAIHSAQANGHLCFINTGRPMCTIDSKILDIGFDGYICGCGTYVQYKDEIIYHASLENNVMKEIIELSNQCHMESVFEGYQASYFPEYMEYEFVRDCFNYHLEEGFPSYIYKNNESFIFEKIATFVRESSDLNRFLDYFKKDESYDVIDRGNGFFEIVPMYCTKASGIQRLIDHLNYSIDQTISIGDSTNDLSMLTYTKESIAMGNADQVLFDKVTYITTAVDNDGIYNALKHFNIIK